MRPASVLKLLRPYHWIKNLLLFAPLFFSGHFRDVSLVWATVLGFAAFSLVASMVYVVNDFCDREKDREHPKKKDRPLASGAISTGQAVGIFAALALAAAAVAWRLPFPFAILLGTYFVSNVAYSLRAKHMVILDLLSVAIMYFLRVLGGALIIGVEVSAWIFITVFFGALFLVAAKRYAEYRSVRAEKRSVLAFYNETILSTVFTVSMTASLIAYSLYTVSRDGQYFYSIVFIAYIYLRYAYLVFGTGAGEEPESALVRDPGVVIAGLGWLAFSIFAYYYAG